MNNKKKRLNKSVLQFTLVIILLSLTSIAVIANLQLSSEKVSPNEPITINIDVDNTTDLSLVIKSEDSQYRYLGYKKEVKFIPKQEGLYGVTLFRLDEIIDKKIFEVKIELPPPADYVQLSGNQYVVNEPFVLNLANDLLIYNGMRVVINAPDGNYQYLGAEGNISFIPRTPGNYNVQIIMNGLVIFQRNFIIYSGVNTSTEGTKILFEPVMKNSVGDELSAEISFVDELGNIQPVELGGVEIPKGKHKVIVAPRQGPIQEIVINDAVLETNNTGFINIDVIDHETKKPIDLGFTDKNVKQFEQVYAIDPTAMNFTDAVVTVTAKGTELFKCADWNFDNQQCLGTWEKVMNIERGQQYSFIISSADPGYAETGVATINTNKSIYHPNEEVNVIMVVLDINGFLVNDAVVDLVIMSPNNISYSYSTSSENIIRTSNGIYEANFLNTNLEGNYSLYVRATGSQVNHSMLSRFVVKDFYEFDILRDTPVTIDPWRGPFLSSIRLISYLNNISIFNFSEVLPINFNITNHSGAILTEEGNSSILTWENLTNNSIVSYTARAPLVSPDLYEIGPSRILYGTNIFYEARPWYLAIDPAVNMTLYIHPDGATLVCGTTYNPSAGGYTSNGLYDTATCTSRTRLRNGPGGTDVFVTSYNVSTMAEDTLVTAFSASMSYKADPGDSLWYELCSYSGGITGCFGNSSVTTDTSGNDINEILTFTSSGTIPTGESIAIRVWVTDSSGNARFYMADDGSNGPWNSWVNLTVGENNYPPTHNTPILNASTLFNYTTNDLYCNAQNVSDQDDDATENTYSWNLEGAPVTVLNMPFQGASTASATPDFSSLGNDGTVTGATYNRTNGFNGFGAYEFFDTVDYIDVGNDNSLAFAGPFSLVAWINADSAGPADYQTIINREAAWDNRNYWFTLWTDGTLHIRMSSSASNTDCDISDTTDLRDGNWHHVAATYNGTHCKLYLDGSQLNSDPVSGTIDSGTQSTYIGTEVANTGRSFDGFIDEVLILNRSLSVNQINQLYLNNTHVLVSNETLPGDNWSCEVTPYDSNANGSTLTSNTFTISNTTPPVISLINCYNGTAWGTCDNIGYGDTIEQVRVSCDSTMGGLISNVSVNLSNVDDTKTFFDGLTTDNTSGYWVYNNTDLTINDSGEFNLKITCRENPETISNFGWNISFGTLSGFLISHKNNSEVYHNLTFNFTAQVTCSGGECGDINVTLDPISWWNANWKNRKLINITTVDALGENYTANFTINTTGTDFLNNASDLRIIYWDGTSNTELDRYVVNNNTANTVVWFRIQESILASTSNESYYMYFNNTAATTAPSNISNVFIYAADFELGAEGWTTSGQSYTWERANNFAGTAVTGCYSPDNTCIEPTTARLGNYAWGTNVGGVYLDDTDSWGYVTSPAINLSTYAAESVVLSYYLAHELEGGGFDRGQVEIDDNSGFASPTQTELINPTACDATTCNYVDWYEDFIDISAYNTDLYLRVSMESDTGWHWTGLYFDLVTVRLNVTNEPTTVLGATETPSTVKGIIPVSSGSPFYTSTANPIYPVNNACLYNMVSGDSCNVSWIVNATGEVGSSWEFFIISQSINYSTNINSSDSNKSTITILGGGIPPVVTLTSPLNDTFDNDGNVSLTCTVTDDLDLINVTLYTNLTGWGANQTINYAGSNDTSVQYQFNLTNISDGTNFIWNCLAFDSINQSRFAYVNHTVKVNFSADELPEVVLNSPTDGSTQINAFSVDFNCSATDDKDILNLNLFTNRTGTFAFEQTKIYSGSNDTSVSNIFTVSGFTDNQNVGWNCKAIDNSSQEVFYSSNYTFTVDLLEPNVTLNTPAAQYVSLDGNVTFNCSAQDDQDLTNLTLYTTLTGSWAPNLTVTFPGTQTEGSLQTTLQIPTNTFMYWNCLAYDNDSLKSVGIVNQTVSVPPPGLPYFASSSSYGGDWKNPQWTTQAPDGLTGDEDLDKGKTLYTYDYTGLPTSGTIISVYLTLQYAMELTPVDDELLLSYSKDGGVTWLNLDGTSYTEASSVPIFPISPANITYEITGALDLSELSTTRLRIIGKKVGGADKIKAYIDSLFLTLRYSPPPNASNVVKNQTIVYQNDVIMFNSTWQDDIGLGCFIFSLNQTGTFVNSSCINLNGLEDIANYSTTITAAVGTEVQWLFYANDSDGAWAQTDLQVFTVADYNDIISPVVNSINVTPTVGQALSVFNISANITDNIGVGYAYAEILFPSGTKINYSMSTSGGDIWRYSHTGLMGGNYSFQVWAFDGGNNSDLSNDTAYFNVTALIQADQTYYIRGDTVQITGYGYSPTGEVTLNITDAFGVSVTGFPGNTTSDTDGNISDVWTIPSVLTFSTGNHTLEGRDTQNSLLYDDTSFLVVIVPTLAEKMDETFKTGVEITTDVNWSEDTTNTIYAKNDNDRMNFTFQGNLLAGYVPNETFFYLEHLDNGVSDIFVDILSGGTFVNVCTFAQSTSQEAVDSCNISSYITDFATADDIVIQIRSDGTLDKVDFTTIDFAFLTMTIQVGNVLAVTLTDPQDIAHPTDFTDTVNNDAFEGTTTNEPPNSMTRGTQASGADETALSASDNSRWRSTFAVDAEQPYQSFFFKVSQPLNEINSMDFTFEGYVTKETALRKDDFRIFAWNYATSTYDLLSADPVKGQATDMTVTVTMSSTNYINSTGDNAVNLIVIGKSTMSAAAPKNQSDIFTDYVKFTVNTIQTIGGFQYVNATAIDSDGINNCSYYYTNSTGFVFNVSSMTNISTSDFYNLSDTTIYDDGIYNITVTCEDTTSEIANDSIRVKINNQAPSLVLLSPTNNSNFTLSNTVTFIWNATAAAGSPICDLYFDGVLNESSIVANSGLNTSQNITSVLDGRHNWSVSCKNSADVYNNSEIRWIDVDLNPPFISLVYPSNNQYVNTSNITFNYTPSDAHNISSCSLYVDGAFDQTNTSITLNSANTFLKTGMTSGAHNWSVNCTDIYDFSNQTITNNFTIDLQNPSIALNYPNPGEIFIGGYVPFNYTATDNIDTSLLCDIVVDSVIIDANITSPNGTDVVRNLEVGDGFKLWYVQCRDNSGRQNVSETRNFTVQGAPTVNLLTPATNTVTTLSSVNFTYFVEDSDGVTNCSLYIDDSFNQSNQSNIVNPGNNSFLVSMPTERKYNWTVQCIDTTSRSTKPSPFNLTIDRTSPSIVLEVPIDGANLSNGDVQFNFTVTDNLDSEIYCNLTVNGVVSGTNNNFAVANNSRAIRNETSLPQGTNTWSVSCWDDASNTNTTSTWSFFVGGDPEVLLQTPTNNSYENENVTFTYKPTDTLGLNNCSLYINGIFNQSNSLINNGVSNNFTLANITEQALDWNVTCTNTVDLSTTSLTNRLYIDTTNPTIQLNYPGEGVTLTNTSVVFNFTASDNNDTSLSCDLYIDGTLNVSNISAPSGQPTTQIVNNLSESSHTWSVLCLDDATNSVTSATNNFSISISTNIDLFTYSSYIMFSNNQPVEGENITINATIFNNGTTDANSLIIQFFDGDPSTTGSQIGNNVTINLVGNTNVTVNETWISTQGTHYIYVLIDPPYLSGSFSESNEINNKVNTTLNVSIWQIYYGVLNATLMLSNDANESLRTWFEENLNGNIFVSDNDVTGGISFTSLKEIYRTSAGAITADTNNDFEDIDTNLFTTNYTDNINNTYSSGGPPKLTKSWLVYSTTLANVPYDNSTNTSSFVTGILWDSDDSTNAYYDTTEDEDLVFVTKINKSSIGKYGTYDYEIKIPSNLKSYKGSSEQVNFYFELQ